MLFRSNLFRECGVADRLSDTAQNALRAPRATDHWYDHARADHGDEWNRVFGAAMKERL